MFFTSFIILRNLQEHLCRGLFFKENAEKEILVRVFSCEFWEIFQLFSIEHIWWLCSNKLVFQKLLESERVSQDVSDENYEQKG